MKDVEAGLKGIRARVLHPMTDLVDEFSRGLGKLTTTLREWAVPTVTNEQGQQVPESIEMKRIWNKIDSNIETIASAMGDQTNHTHYHN